MFKNRVLRRIFGPKRIEVTREWSKLHNEALNVLYYSLNIVWVIKSKKNEMGRALSTYTGDERRAHGFGGETWGKESTGDTQA